MPGKVLNLDDLITRDQLGCRIAQFFQEWNTLRSEKVSQWEELRRYVYAVDTTTTTNSALPWKNKTTIPKLCQIRDNLYSNYIASMFPRRKWLIWEGDDNASDTKEKRDAITGYISWVIDQPQFKSEVDKLVLDYIDYGNVFATVEWQDERQELPDRNQVGYVGPAIKRISPLDIAFNPVAASFTSSPKIIRSLVSMGEVKEMLSRMSTDADRETNEALFAYMRDLRNHVSDYTGELQVLDSYFSVDGFSSYKSYLDSGYVELLTFYGDIYDQETDTFLRNHVLVVADRHKVLTKKPNPSFFGQPPIYHCGWRVRQDNLWAMGPLDNLVGMQYRIDHIENLKADLFDLIAFPPLKITGTVEDFEWGPFEKIFVGDEGDVEVLAPNAQIAQADFQIEKLEGQMEQMAGAPKEAMGFRTPGEKTMYEVQRLENAASRIFQSKIAQFEEQLIERLLNAMLELSRRNITNTTIRAFDDQNEVAVFLQLTPEDITGQGRIRPIAARHFAERAQRVQDLNNFFSSPVGQDQTILQHFSSIGIARLFEELIDIEDYDVVEPFVRLSEQADAQRLMNSHEEQVQMETMTPSGINPDDADEDV